VATEAFNRRWCEKTTGQAIKDIQSWVRHPVIRWSTRTRAKAREADWRRQLARAFVYQSGRSPEQAEELLAEYEAREKEGPDFMRFRPQSVIADPPLVTSGQPMFLFFRYCYRTPSCAIDCLRVRQRFFAIEQAI
jgi:hypothetical protein